MAARAVGDTPYSDSYHVAVTPRTDDQDFGADEIYFEQMQNPLIAPCGHTFDRNTWDGIIARALQANKQPQCPKDRSIINRDLLIPNYFARQSIERENQLRPLEMHREQQLKDTLFEKTLREKEVVALTQEKAGLEQSMQEVLSELREGKRERQLMLDRIEESKRENQQIALWHQERHAELVCKVDEQSQKIDTLTAENIELKAMVHGQGLEIQKLTHENQEVKKEYQEAKRDNQEIKRAYQAVTQAHQESMRMIQQIQSTCQELTENMAIKDRQIRNLIGMNMCDKVWSFFDAVSLETVANRGIPQQQLEQQRQLERAKAIKSVSFFLQRLKIGILND